MQLHVGNSTSLSLSGAVPIHTVNDTTIRLREFRLRFFAADTIVQPTQEVRTRYGRDCAFMKAPIRACSSQANTIRSP